MKTGPERPKIYWFNWPSHVGGADTKFAHLLPLLSSDCDITVVPNGPDYLKSEEWQALLRRTGVRAALLDELPDRVEGWAVSLCNGKFLSGGMAREMKRRGAKIVWSNEMMWHFPGEAEAIQSGLIDRILYVSAAQRQALEPGYIEAGAAVNTSETVSDENAVSGVIPRRHAPALRWILTGNWIDPDAFTFRPRGDPNGAPFTIGRLSRPDPDKFPDNFPRSYERLGLHDPVRFRVMGWSDQLRERWCEHLFDERWDLVPTASEPVPAFLNSLDVFVYDLSPRFRESWGRAVVEAMLRGAVPLVPAGGGHHLEQLVQHGISGFLCAGAEEFGRRARALQDDAALLHRLSIGAREDACTRHCHAETHRRLWRMVFE